MDIRQLHSIFLVIHWDQCEDEATYIRVVLTPMCVINLDRPFGKQNLMVAIDAPSKIHIRFA